MFSEHVGRMLCCYPPPSAMPQSCPIETAYCSCTSETGRSCAAEPHPDHAPQKPLSNHAPKKPRHDHASQKTPQKPLPNHAPKKRIAETGTDYAPQNRAPVHAPRHHSRIMHRKNRCVYSETIDAKISDENKCESIMNYDLGWYNSQQEESWGAQAGTIRAQIMLRNAAAPRCGFACGCRLISVIPMRRREIP